MAQLSEQVAEGRRLAERVRQQLVAAAHMVDSRHAQAAKKHDTLAQQVQELSNKLTTLLKAGGSSPLARAAGSGASGATPGARRDAGDPLLLGTKSEHSCSGHS